MQNSYLVKWEIVRFLFLTIDQSFEDLLLLLLLVLEHSEVVVLLLADDGHVAVLGRHSAAVGRRVLVRGRLIERRQIGKSG